jgi:hypothetical protein
MRVSDALQQVGTVDTNNGLAEYLIESLELCGKKIISAVNS